MEARYEDWVKANVEGDGYGHCAEITEAMAEAFPELRRVRGHYYCPFWGERTHWWMETADGEIVDPTLQQFPSLGMGAYVEWNDGDEQPIGKCLNCGEYTFASKGGDKNFCSDACSTACVAQMNRSLRWP